MFFGTFLESKSDEDDEIREPDITLEAFNFINHYCYDLELPVITNVNETSVNLSLCIASLIQEFLIAFNSLRF